MAAKVYVSSETRGGLSVAETIDRRRFLALAGCGVALGALAAVQGCWSGSESSGTTPVTPTPTPTPTPTTTYVDKKGQVGSNHPAPLAHSITLTAAQQKAAVDVTIHTTGSDHEHKLFLTAAELAKIAAGTKVAGESSVTNSHSHLITFNP
jgi:hypothetical protein